MVKPAPGETLAPVLSDMESAGASAPKGKHRFGASKKKIFVVRKAG